MTSAKERLGLSLRVSTREEPAVRPGGIKRVSESDVSRRYRLGAQVMESTNVGMEVVKAVRLSDNLNCVIKTRQRPKSFKSPEQERDWRRTTEVQLGMPKTERLCQLYEVLETESMYYVVMEKVGGKDLYEVMGEARVSAADAREILRQVFDALVVLHRHGRIHKDLKIENVMVDMSSTSPDSGSAVVSKQSTNGGSPATAKLIDFDTVEDWEPSSPKAKEVLGTDGYIAPEAYLGEYSPASDIYAAGVVMYKVLVGDFPTREEIFDDQPGENWVGSPQMKRIYERLKTASIDFSRPPFNSDVEAADLCAKLLSFDAADRPSASDALQHPWFFLG